MATLVVLFYALVGVFVTLTVMHSCPHYMDNMDYVSKGWLVTRWVLGWPVKLWQSFNYGILG